MSRPASIRQPVFASLTLACLAASWWGCAKGTGEPTTDTSSSSSTSQSASSGSGGAGGTGGTEVTIDGGPDDDSGSCVSTSVAAEHIKLDIIFVIDQSASMSGPKWQGTTKALTTFFKDPASASIGAGLVYFPNHKAPTATCVPEDYKTLDVPINTLPVNSFLLTNSMPADATGNSTPTYGAVKGALMAATAYQDAHPTHKVTLVLATDGEPNACGATTIDDIANLAKSARNYNGVLTYVIGVAGSSIANLDKIAAAGGTTAAYDITNDISLFSKKMEEIRSAALGCEFEIPPPPDSQVIDPDKVNFSYTPKGVGMSKVLLRADNLADCNNKPGWYFDSNGAPTKIILCPASCTTVQADTSAKISVLFGCKSQIN
jgi:Mg-chelatase subunit ChlD